MMLDLQTTYWIHSSIRGEALYGSPSVSTVKRIRDLRFGLARSNIGQPSNSRTGAINTVGIQG